MSSTSPLPELPAIGFLAEMAPSYRAFLASFGKFVRPAKGEALIEEGQPAGLVGPAARGDFRRIPADPVAGVEFMTGLLRLAGHRLRAMNEKVADARRMMEAIRSL